MTRKEKLQRRVNNFVAAAILITIMALCTPLFYRALYQHVVMADNKGTILMSE